MDLVSWWTEIRHYNLATLKFLRASFKCPFMLLSATMEKSSLERILSIKKELIE